MDDKAFQSQLESYTAAVRETCRCERMFAASPTPEILALLCEAEHDERMEFNVLVNDVSNEDLG